MKNVKYYKPKHLLSATAIALTLYPAAAIYGQERPIANDQNLTLEEIVVTAAKRTQTLQEVPMAITAFGTQQLERMGATDFIDYASKVPNMGFGADGDGRFDSRKTGIRGVFGGGQSTAGGTTGFYIDEMPIPETMNPRVTDVERIEVLRGPQGTLYGARSMGGTIRVISKQPSLTTAEGQVHSTVSNVKEGNFNWSVDGSASVPIVPNKLGVRVLGYYAENSGVQDRVWKPGSPGPYFNPQKNVDSEKYYGGQITAKVALTENLTFTPKLIYQKTTAGGSPFADYKPGNFTQVRNFNLSESGRDRFYIVSGNINWETSIGTIVSTTGYMNRRIFENEDESLLLTYFFDTPPIPSIISKDQHFNSTVHETRFTSKFGGKIQINAGIFYQATNQQNVFPPAYAIGLDQAFTEMMGDPYPPGDLGTDLIYTTDSHFDTREKAAFFEISYDATNWLKATVGGRYSQSKTIYHVTGDGLANGGPSAISGKQSENRFSPKFLLEAKASQNIKFYTTASEGYRIGGVNGNIPPDLCATDLAQLGNPDLASLRTFKSDSLWNYEVGMKSSLADNRATLNVAAFYVDWKNVIQRIQPTCGFAFFTNAGNATNKGFEVELNTLLFKGFNFSFGMGYTDARFKDITNPFSPVKNGDRVQQVPKWTLTSSAQYSVPIGKDFEAYIGGDVSYQSDSLSANNEIATPRVRPSWVLVNARAGVDNGRWELAAFVKNLTDKHINLADNKSLAAEYPGRPRIVTNRPRTIGAEVRYRF